MYRSETNESDSVWNKWNVMHLIKRGHRKPFRHTSTVNQQRSSANYVTERKKHKNWGRPRCTPENNFNLRLKRNGKWETGVGASDRDNHLLVRRSGIVAHGADCYSFQGSRWTNALRSRHQEFTRMRWRMSLSSRVNNTRSPTYLADRNRFSCGFSRRRSRAHQNGFAPRLNPLHRKTHR